MADGANEATEVVRFTYEFEFNNLMAGIMEFKVQFWHPSDLRLWRSSWLMEPMRPLRSSDSLRSFNLIM